MINRIATNMTDILSLKIVTVIRVTSYNLYLSLCPVLKMSASSMNASV